jgi:hypothetical protein
LTPGSSGRAAPGNGDMVRPEKESGYVNKDNKLGLSYANRANEMGKTNPCKKVKINTWRDNFEMNGLSFKGD